MCDGTSAQINYLHTTHQLQPCGPQPKPLFKRFCTSTITNDSSSFLKVSPSRNLLWCFCSHHTQETLMDNMLTLEKEAKTARPPPGGRLQDGLTCHSIHPFISTVHTDDQLIRLWHRYTFTDLIFNFLNDSSRPQSPLNM